MKRIIALGDMPLLLAADENLFAKAFNYQDRDLEEELRWSRPSARRWRGPYAHYGRNNCN